MYTIATRVIVNTMFSPAISDIPSSEGALAAARLYPQFSRNVPFSMFLRWLKSLEEELSGQSVIVLDPSTLQGVKYFSEGASLPSGAPGAGKDQKRK